MTPWLDVVSRAQLAKPNSNHRGEFENALDCAMEMLDRDAILIMYTHRENETEWDCFDTG